MVTTTSSKTFNLQANTQKVIKEINWPLITSIVFHGVFFTVVFPQWHNENSSDNQGFSNTPIVELNAIEQTRLPNFNPPATFNGNNIGINPPLDNSLPSIPLEALNIPTPPSTGDFPPPSFDTSGLMNLPMPPSLPPSASLPPVNYRDNFYLPSPPVSNSVPSNFELPPPPPVDVNTIANLPAPTIDFNTPKNGKVIDITADPNQERIITQEEAEIRQRIFANSDVEITANPRDVINGRISGTLAIRGENDPPFAFQPNTSLTAKLQKDTVNTSDEEARKNYVAWAKEVQSINPKQVILSGVYPKDACVGKLEGTATYGITVDANGNVISSQIIKSSGYPIFNDQGFRQIRSQKFSNDTGVNQPYRVDVNFNYNPEICPNLSITNMGESTPKNNSPNSNSPTTPSPTNTTATPPKEEIKSPTVSSPVKPNPPLVNSTSPVKPQENIGEVTPKNEPSPSEVTTPETPASSTPSPEAVTPPVKNEDSPPVKPESPSGQNDEASSVDSPQ